MFLSNQKLVQSYKKEKENPLFFIFPRQYLYILQWRILVNTMCHMWWFWWNIQLGIF